MPKNSLFCMNDNGQPSWGDQDDHDDDITSLQDDDINSLDDDYLNSFNNDSDHVITTNCVYSQQEIDYLETHVKNFVEEQRITVLDTIQKGIIKDNGKSSETPDNAGQSISEGSTYTYQKFLSEFNPNHCNYTVNTKKGAMVIVKKWRIS